MTVVPPRAPSDDAPPAFPGTPGTAPTTVDRPAPRRVSVERIVLGLLLAAVGGAWMLDELGVPIPWALAPAAGVVVIGVALVLAARTREGHAPLVVWGAILLAVSLLVAVVRPVGGPVGDRLVVPAADQWPVATSLTAGKLTIDLRQNPLPPAGRLTADVTAGNVVLRLPNPAGSPRVHVVAHVGMGQIRVDGLEVRGGMGLEWTSPEPAAVVVDVHVGTGQLEVDHG